MKHIFNIILILLLLNPSPLLSQQTMDKPVKIQNPEAITGRDKNKTTPKQNITTNKSKSNLNPVPTTAKNIITNPKVDNKSTDEKTDCSKNKAKPIKSWWHTSENWMMVFTGILAIFTILLWRATVKIVATTERTANRQLRAYVSARLADGEKVFLDENNCLSVPLIIENHGQTPAHNFRKSTFVNIFKLPIETILDPPEYEGGSVNSLFPGQKVRMYPTLPQPLSDAEITAIKNKEGCFCVWGYLEYIDIFGVTQTSTFRMLSTGDDLERGELAYCEEGNKAT